MERTIHVLLWLAGDIMLVAAVLFLSRNVSEAIGVAYAAEILVLATIPLAILWSKKRGA